jgi:hypothetical protein
MDLLAIVETVFFDFALIGSLVAFLATVMARLIFRPRAPVAHVFPDSVETLHRRIGDINAPDAALAAALVVVAGITFNVVADEAFDNGIFVFERFFQGRGDEERLEGCDRILPSDVQPIEDFPRRTRHSRLLSRDFLLRNEDQIKQDVVRDVCSGAGPASPAQKFLQSHSTHEGAKQLAQVAMATVLESGTAANTALRAEFLGVKLARTFALLSAVFLLAVMGRLMAPRSRADC